jgi:Tfp pilus assembly protein PilN
MTYSSSISMSRSVARGQHFAGRNQNAVDFRRSGAKLGPISNTVILIVLACLLGLLYLTQVTKTDAYGYSINTLQTKQTQLKQENEDLVLASAQMQSLDRVQSSPEATAMVPVAPSGTVRQ